jgi:hypothetical protein
MATRSAAVPGPQAVAPGQGRAGAPAGSCWMGWMGMSWAAGPACRRSARTGEIGFPGRFFTRPGSGTRLGPVPRGHPEEKFRAHRNAIDNLAGQARLAPDKSWTRLRTSRRLRPIQSRVCTTIVSPSRAYLRTSARPGDRVRRPCRSCTGSYPRNVIVELALRNDFWDGGSRVAGSRSKMPDGLFNFQDCGTATCRHGECRSRVSPSPHTMGTAPVKSGGPGRCKSAGPPPVAPRPPPPIPVRWQAAR